MSQFRQFWIRFRIGENESTHQITDVSLNPLGNYKEDFHVIEYSALEAAHKEIEQLKSIFSVQLDILEQNKQLTAALKVAEDALEISKCKTWHKYNSQGNWTLDIHDDKECVKCKAIAEIQKIKKGE